MVAARWLRLPAWESTLAKSAGLYVYGMGRTEICVCVYVYVAVAKRETWCGASKDSRPSPLLIRKQEENIACCRSMWLQLPAWERWQALLVVVYIYVWVVVGCPGVLWYCICWHENYVRKSGVTCYVYVAVAKGETGRVASLGFQTVSAVSK